MNAPQRSEVLDQIADAFFTDPEYFKDLILTQNRVEDAICIVYTMIGIVPNGNTHEEV